MKLSSIPYGTSVFIDANIFLFDIFEDTDFGAVVKEMNIKNIATNDEDFERVDFLRIWKP